MYNLKPTPGVFTACALLSPMRWNGIMHVYEHDVESVFWVAMWVVFCSGDEPLARNCPLTRKDTSDLNSFVKEKRYFWYWFHCLQRSSDARVRTEHKRWKPLHSGNVEEFTKCEFVATNCPNVVYPRLLEAKLQGEQAVPRKKPPRQSSLDFVVL